MSKRWFLIGAAVAVAIVAAVTVALAYYPLFFLPRPEVADRDSLLRWMVLRDLSQEEPATVRALAVRIDEEFGQDAAGFDVVQEGLKPAHQEQLRSNIPVLLSAWFEEKMDRYEALADEARAKFLDGVLDAVDRWRDIGNVSQTEAGVQRTSGVRSAVFEYIGQWKDRLEPNRRKKADQFLMALQTRWVMRKLFTVPGQA